MQWLDTASVCCMTVISFPSRNTKAAIHDLQRFAPSGYVMFFLIALNAQTTEALFNWHMLIAYSRRPTSRRRWAARTEPFADVWKICGGRVSSRQNAQDTTAHCGFTSRKRFTIILHHRKLSSLDFGNNFRTESFSDRFGNIFRSHRKNFPFRFGNIFRLVPYTVLYTISYQGLYCNHACACVRVRVCACVRVRGGGCTRIGFAG